MSEYGLLIDVTDTVSVSFTTGIQRVVKEFAARLVTRFPTVRLLRFCAETHQFDVLDNESFLKKTNGVSDRVLVTRHLNIEDIRENSCFLDLDSVWNSYHLRRQNLYKVLKEQGAKIGTLVYDIIPITYPQFCHADTVFHFLPYMSAVLEFSDFILVNTESTKEKVRWLAEQTGVGEKTIHVVPLGADFSQITPDGGKPVSIGGAARKAVEAGRYLFMMGTIEPRKNHKVLLDAFDRELYQTDINIVIAGRVGWNVEALIQRIKTHPQYNKRIFFVERPSDSDVKYLYDNAFAIVFASFEEGFGLPIMEAFHHKKMVFSSNADVLREVGGDLAEYFDPKNPEELCRLVRSYLSEPQKRERAVARLDSCRFLSWEECTDLLADKLRLENIALSIEQQIR